MPSNVQNCYHACNNHHFIIINQKKENLISFVQSIHLDFTLVIYFTTQSTKINVQFFIKQKFITVLLRTENKIYDM